MSINYSLKNDVSGLIREIESTLAKKDIIPIQRWHIISSYLIYLGNLIRKNAIEEKEMLIQLLLGRILNHRYSDSPPPVHTKILCSKLLLLSIIQFGVLDTLSNTSATLLYSQVEAELFYEQKPLNNPDIQFIISIFDTLYPLADSLPQGKRDDVFLAFSALQRYTEPGNKHLSEFNERSLSFSIEFSYPAFKRVKEFQKAEEIQVLNKLSGQIGCPNLRQNDQIEQKTLNLLNRRSRTNEEIFELQNILCDKIKDGSDDLISLIIDDLSALYKDAYQRYPDVLANIESNTAVQPIVNNISNEKYHPPKPIDMEYEVAMCGLSIVEDYLSEEKIKKNSEFIPRHTQYHFISLIITTLDSSDLNSKDFENGDGPCTDLAIDIVMKNLGFYNSFLKEWCTFEFSRNSEARYNSLLLRILEEMAKKMENDRIRNEEQQDNQQQENFILSLLFELPYVPTTIFRALTSKCRETPTVAKNIIDALTKFSQSSQRPSLELLNSIIDLISNAHLIQCPAEKEIDEFNKEQVQVSNHAAFTIVNNFYSAENLNLIDNKAILSLLDALHFKSALEDFSDIIRNMEIPTFEQITEDPPFQPSLDDPIIKMKTVLFFDVLEKNQNLLVILFGIYGNGSRAIKNLIANQVNPHISAIGYSHVLSEILTKTSESNVKLLHYILHRLSSEIQVPTELSKKIRQQWNIKQDAHYLLPIIPLFGVDEFRRCLPSILGLTDKGIVRQLINKLITGKKQFPNYPITSLQLLTELQKIKEDQAEFNNAVEAVRDAISHIEWCSYQDCTGVIENTLRTNRIEVILMDTLYAVVNTHRKSMKGCGKWATTFILKEILTNDSVADKMMKSDHAWANIKNVLYFTTPTSLKTALLIPDENRLYELIRDYQSNTRMSIETFLNVIDDAVSPEKKDKKQLKDKKTLKEKQIQLLIRVRERFNEQENTE